MCAGGFELILQVSSTLWPDRKPHKISERRIRLKWIKCSLRTRANPVKTGRATTFGQKEAQTSPTRSSWGRLEPWAGRPASWSADLAHGPHRLNFATWCFLTGSQSRFYKEELHSRGGSLL